MNSRERLGLSVDEYADLLGVVLSTIYRWENQGYDLSKIDPLRRRLLILIEGLVEEGDQSVSEALGDEIKFGLKKGPLQGLYALLHYAHKEL